MFTYFLGFDMLTCFGPLLLQQQKLLADFAFVPDLVNAVLFLEFASGQKIRNGLINVDLFVHFVQHFGELRRTWRSLIVRRLLLVQSWTKWDQLQRLSTDFPQNCLRLDGDRPYFSCL